MDHAEADGGAILLEVEGELRLANSRGIDAPESLVCSDHVRRVQEEVHPTWGRPRSPPGSRRTEGSGVPVRSRAEFVPFG
jgi:hypothetical protein